MVRCTTAIATLVHVSTARFSLAENIRKGA